MLDVCLAYNGSKWCEQRVDIGGKEVYGSQTYTDDREQAVKRLRNDEQQRPQVYLKDAVITCTAPQTPC